ncbi:MAG: argininosuccinate lyase [Vicinamibacteria bacterium]
MKLWGGNYSGDPDKAFWEFNRSFPFDQRLLAEEVAASRAYARALGRCGAIPAADAATLDEGLSRVLEHATSDPAYLDIDVEDVHSFVETRLGELLGDLAGQGHLGRSRNEQAVTALRLWIRGSIDELSKQVAALVEGLAEQGWAGADAVMPGYTHTRGAEPIAFGHWAAAHAWGLVRDHERLGDARRRINVLPLGSGALAGTSLPLDREALAQELGFEAVSENALDAVMDRDFAAEFVFVCAQIQAHLARLAEDLIWHSGPEFGFVRLPEAFTTGSSLMPQKKNPDALELVRGKAARVSGDLLRLLSLMKGLPAGYQKDLQEDKEAVFDAADTALASVVVMTGVVAGLRLEREAMRGAVSEEMMAAALAVALAREGIPFRKAHAIVGTIVAEAQRDGISVRAAAERALSAQSPALAGRLDMVFDPAQAIRAKAARGGTAPDAVRASLDAALGRVRVPSRG